MFINMLYVLCLLALRGICCCNNSREHVKALLANYSSELKPRLNLSEPVEVHMILHMRSLREISKKYQRMTFAAWFELTWIDDFLVLGEGIESIRIPIKNVWIPDISLYNSVEDPQHMSDGNHVVLLKNGKVVWYPGREYTVRCAVTIRNYPFDTQKCAIRVGAWQAPIWTQMFKVDSDSLDLTTFGNHGEWSIVTHYVKTHFSKSYGVSWIRFDIHFQRRPLFVLLNSVFPIILLSLLNTLTFRLPADSGEKITLCISVMLAFTVFLTVFSENMPKISTEVSYLSLYLCVQLALSALAIVGTVYIWRVKYNFSKQTTKTLCNVTKSRHPYQTTKDSQDQSYKNVDPVIIGYKFKKDNDVVKISGQNKILTIDSDQNENRGYNSIESIYTSGDDGDPRRFIERMDNILFIVSLTTSVLSTSLLFILLLTTRDKS